MLGLAFPGAQRATSMCAALLAISRHRLLFAWSPAKELRFTLVLELQPIRVAAFGTHRHALTSAAPTARPLLCT